MPPGFDRPTSSSASRVSNTGLRQQTSCTSTIRRRCGRFDNPAPVTSSEKPNPPQPVPTQNGSTDPPTLTHPEQPVECQRTPPTGRKSPAYLQGKNPYGRVLERIEHPYCKPRATATEKEAPSQPSPGGDGHPNTLHEFGPRLQTLAPDPRSTDLQSHQQPVEAPFKPPRPVSVQSIKNFYETKSSQCLSEPALLPSAAALSARISVPTPVFNHPSGGGDTHNSRLEFTQALKKEEHNGLSLQCLTESFSTVDTVQSVLPYAQGDASESVPSVVVTNGTSKSLLHEQEHILPETAQEITDHEESMNIFTGQTAKAKPPGSERVVDKSPHPDAAPHAPSGRDNRRAFEKDRGASFSTIGICRSRGAALTEDCGHSEPSAARALSKTSSTNFKAFRNKFNRPLDVDERTADIVSRGLSHDGTSSSIPPQRNSPYSPVLIANIGIEAQYNEIEVPGCVDDRQGFGRRVTQDFGFPGAHIRPRSTTIKRPLQDPGKWAKRACGHFSYMGSNEHREQAQRRRCRQCSTRLPQTQATYVRQACRRTATESTTSVSSFSTKLKHAGTSNSDHHRHHAQRMPNDQCGDRLANDLGRIVDSILEEHASTLQGVIDTIKLSQPGLEKVRKLSRDIIQQCRLGGVCFDPPRLVCASDFEWQVPLPFLPPKAAERLNVGSQGQLGPNLNDLRSRLREAVETVPDLLHLVNSAADDFGVDLDRRPRPKDDELFRSALYENTSCDSTPSCLDMPLEAAEEKPRSNASLSEEDWLQETRRHLADLCSARDQLMHELESIAGDLGVSLSEYEDIKPAFKHAQLGLIEASPDLSADSTQLNITSGTSASEGISRTMKERDWQRPVLARTRASTCLPLNSFVAGI